VTTGRTGQAAPSGAVRAETLDYTRVPTSRGAPRRPVCLPFAAGVAEAAPEPVRLRWLRLYGAVIAFSGSEGAHHEDKRRFCSSGEQVDPGFEKATCVVAGVGGGRRLSADGPCGMA